MNFYHGLLAVSVLALSWLNPCTSQPHAVRDSNYFKKKLMDGESLAIKEALSQSGSIKSTLLESLRTIFAESFLVVPANFHKDETFELRGYMKDDMLHLEASGLDTYLSIIKHFHSYINRMEISYSNGDIIMEHASRVKLHEKMAKIEHLGSLYMHGIYNTDIFIELPKELLENVENVLLGGKVAKTIEIHEIFPKMIVLLFDDDFFMPINKHFPATIKHLSQLKLPNNDEFLKPHQVQQIISNEFDGKDGKKIRPNKNLYTLEICASKNTEDLVKTLREIRSLKQLHFLKFGPVSTERVDELTTVTVDYLNFAAGHKNELCELTLPTTGDISSNGKIEEIVKSLNGKWQLSKKANSLVFRCNEYCKLVKK